MREGERVCGGYYLREGGEGNYLKEGRCVWGGELLEEGVCGECGVTESQGHKHVVHM